MAKSFFDLRNDIFETLTEASALERRADREQKQADMAKVAAEQDRKRRRAREARQDYSRERKRALEMGEGVKVGDTVHLGHGTKGGTGVKGKVHKIDGKMVHIKNDKGDTFKGPMDRVTTQEAIKYDVDKGDTGTVTGKGKRDRSGKGEVEVKYSSKERPSYTAVIKPKDMAMHLRAARRGEKGKTLVKNVRKESIELDELKKSTLMSYKAKAKQDKADIARRNQSVRGPLVGRDRRDFRNRAKGVDAATRRLVARQYQPESFEKLTPAQERDAERRLKPTRATVSKVRLRASDAQVAAKVKQHQDEKGGNPGNTKKRRIRDLRAKLRDHVELEEGRQPFAVVNTADNNEVVATASSEAGAKSIINKADLPPMSIKDKSKLKIVKTRKKQHIGHALAEAHAKDIVKGLGDSDGPFTVVAIKNNKVIKQEGTKMRNMLPAIVKMMRKEVGRGVTIGIEDRKGTIRNTFKEEVDQIDELSPSKLKKYSAKSLRDREDAVRQGYDPSTGQLDPKSERRRKKRLAGFSKAKKKLVAAAEDVEQVDELKMPEKDERGRVKDPTVRAAVKRGSLKADLKADKALRSQDAEGAEGHMTRARKRKIASRTEEVEQVDELKSSTLRSYLDKSRKQNQTRVIRMADQPSSVPADKGEMHKLRKRRKGSEAAASRLDARKHNLEPKLKREEIEQVDELDTKTLKSYIHKASGQVRGDLYTGKHSPKTNKRAKGVAKAKTDLDMRKIAGKDYRKRMG